MIQLNRKATVTIIDIEFSIDRPWIDNQYVSRWKPYYPDKVTDASRERMNRLLMAWCGSIQDAGDYVEYTYDPAQHAPDRPLHFSPTARGNVASGPDELMTE